MPSVSVNRTELYYERHGEGPPIVFCHGDGRDRRAWMPQVEALADEFEVVIYDLNGYGRSGGSDRDEQSFDVHTEDLRALVERLELTRPSVVGWSMGGRVAYTFAARYPGMLRVLVVLEPASPVFPTQPFSVRVLLSGAARVASVVGWPRLLALRRTVQNLRGDPDDAEEPIVDGTGMTLSEYAADAESRVDTTAYNKMSASVRHEMESTDCPDVDFASIDVPTLAITGTDPRDTHEETVTDLVENAPYARHETVPDAGHAAQIENTEAFNQTVQEFLRDGIEAEQAERNQ